MSKIEKGIAANLSTWMQKAKTLFQNRRTPELSGKTFEGLQEAINSGNAYGYLNDVEPSNTTASC